MSRIVCYTVLFAVLVILFAFISIWQRDEIIRIGYQTEALQRERARLTAARTELAVEVERLSRVERIERIATDRLGMRRPRPDQRIYLAPQDPRNSASGPVPASEKGPLFGGQRVAGRLRFPPLSGFMERDARGAAVPTPF